MEIFVGGLLMGLSLVARYLLGFEGLRVRRAAAELCGLEDVKASWLARNVRARAGRVEVRIGVSGNKHHPTRIVVAAPGPPGFGDVSIHSAALGETVRGLASGDEFFDFAFILDGPVPLVFALLDIETRRLLHRANAECRLQLSSGELRVDLADEKAAVVLPSLVEIGRRFARPLDVPRRLVENARQDAEPGVRLHNLLVLIRELPRHPLTAWALRDACSDPSPRVRLQAAREVGAEGRAVLLELVDLDDDAVSAEAVSALDRELPFERATAILDRALIQRRLRTARACLESIGRSGAAAVEVLAEVLERRKEGEVAVAAIRALGATGSPAAEPPLLQALQRDAEDLQVAAAEALGRIGSAAAVLPLQEAAERSRLDSDLPRAARQAIAEIQSRLEGAAPGQLSLAAAEAGRLSLALDPAGQLSLPPEEHSSWPK